ncbi:MAG: hypothetical protein HY820_28000 [Acidobacteria bacterium]|nr:hypothetical protein [Acidobacteriota bacterium]
MNGVITFLAYDGMGRLAGECGQAVLSGGCTTCYLTQDHLGSTRMTTDGGGSVVQRYDYLPFGEPLLAGWNGRSSKYSAGAFPNGNDGQRVKFTGKERDAETASITLVRGT